ncbi:methyl-CpG-binding domain-containing protein 2-like protein [Carex littledalei]|uniref:Methyl-CpG-binding domain-containing protein 2-like protein n=1 Tax=Carex littledalei TaxID=544730 RepID=A0A833RBC8_9POAL|nr:methyl-CpG-binding domain-containing protein 2-like protein [Carex littledalei]
MEAIPVAPPATPKIEAPNPEKPAPTETQPEDPKPERPPKKKVKRSLPVTDTSPEKSLNGSQQLVLYSPVPGVSPGPILERGGVPSIGAFTVQCAACFKWRLIPTKEKYEEIREKILELPFVCERAREWRPEVSCEDKEDISQDGSRLWAIDKPQIPLPPPGWERLIHIRGEGCTRFADVYYAAPNGKKLRSLVEVQRFLDEHKELEAQGVTLNRFSFQIPRPLHDNYVRKKTPNTTPPAAAAAAVPPLPSITSVPDIPVLPQDVQPISCLPPEEASVPLAAMTPPSADTTEPASVIPSVSPISNVKRKIVVKLPSREKNPSSIDASEVAMLDNTEPSQIEATNGTNAD